MNEKKRKWSILGTFLILLGFFLILPGILLVNHLPEGYQYVLAAGCLSDTWQGAVSAIEDLGTVADIATVSARKQDVPLQGVREEISLTLYAVDDAYPEVCHETLLKGRFISTNDVENKCPVLVIDEDTACALYTGGNTIGKVLNIDETDWTIVGIIASKARFGESTACVAYVPITAAAEQQLSMDTLEIRVESSSGSGQAALIQAALEQWWTDGSFCDLSKEKYAALIPIRWTITVAMLLLATWLVKQIVSVSKRDIVAYRERLTQHYPRELAWWVVGKLALLLLLCAVAGVTGIAAMKLLTAPALVFTDWIPENPVSLSDYIERFWAIHRANARSIHYMTREMIMVELSAWLIRWGMLAALGGGLIVRLNSSKMQLHAIAK